MSPIEQLSEVRQGIAGSVLRHLSRQSGVSEKQLARIRDGLHYPSVHTLQRVWDALREMKEAA